MLDASYPLMAATDDAPPVISVLGNATLLNQSCIGIVGARNASLNGKKMAFKLAADLGTRANYCIGPCAGGSIRRRMKAALRSGTIAVVAGGIDVAYPEENQNSMT